MENLLEQIVRIARNRGYLDSYNFALNWSEAEGAIDEWILITMRRRDTRRGETQRVYGGAVNAAPDPDQYCIDAMEYLINKLAQVLPPEE